MNWKKRLYLAFKITVVLLIVAFNFLILWPGYSRARYNGFQYACTENLKKIGTDLEFYSDDNNGQYPDKLEKLKVNGESYLESIPECKARDDFFNKIFYFRSISHKSYGYIVSDDFTHYTLYCNTPGLHGRLYESDKCWPQYNPVEGVKIK